MIYTIGIVNIVISIAVVTNTEIAAFGATVVGPLISCNAEELLCKGARQ
jgi:hypothetical protein